MPNTVGKAFAAVSALMLTIPLAGVMQSYEWLGGASRDANYHGIDTTAIEYNLKNPDAALPVITSNDPEHTYSDNKLLDTNITLGEGLSAAWISTAAGITGIVLADRRGLRRILFDTNSDTDNPSAPPNNIMLQNGMAKAGPLIAVAAVVAAPFVAGLAVKDNFFAGKEPG